MQKHCGGGRDATFSPEYFIQNKDLVVKQANLNDAHREKFGFGQEKRASVPAIYKKQSQTKTFLWACSCQLLRYPEEIKYGLSPRLLQRLFTCKNRLKSSSEAKHQNALAVLSLTGIPAQPVYATAAPLPIFNRMRLFIMFLDEVFIVEAPAIHQLQTIYVE